MYETCKHLFTLKIINSYYITLIVSFLCRLVMNSMLNLKSAKSNMVGRVNFDINIH